MVYYRCQTSSCQRKSKHTKERNMMKNIYALEHCFYHPLTRCYEIDELAYFEEEYHEGELQEKLFPVIEQYLKQCGYTLAKEAKIEDILAKGVLEVYQPQEDKVGQLFLRDYELNQLINVWG